MPARISLLVAVVFLSSLWSSPFPALAQVSDPVHHDHVVTKNSNKFLRRTVLPDTHDDDEAEYPRDECHANLRLRWQSEVSSSVYATPVITDLWNDGHKQIVVPSFVHLLEALEGENGGRAAGAWPAFHKSHVHASAVVRETERGTEILLPTYDGEVLFFNHDGSPAMGKKLTIPPLPVKRNWYVHLSPDHVDHSAPDVGSDETETFESGFRAPETDVPPHGDASAGLEQQQRTKERATNQATRANHRKLLQEEQRAPGADAGEHTLTDEAAASFSVFEDDEDGYEEGVYSEEGHYGEIVDVEANDDDEDVSDGTYTSWQGAENGIPHGDARQGVGRRAPSDLEGHGEGDPGTAPDSYRHIHRAPGWRDESYQRPKGSDESNAPFVHVDAHLLCTPSVADVDGDGRHEIILAVSHFFDKEYYENSKHFHELRNHGITQDKLGKYVANAIVVVDYETLETKWKVQLDLSTDEVNFKAYIYSAPTAVDLDGDGVMEIVVGTSVGFLYVLSGKDGTTLSGFPKQMGEIQGQVAVADLTGNGFLDIIAADTRGSVAVFDVNGKEIWETHLASLISQGVTIGDVDGDGRLEVVVGTSSGAVHVLRGDTGAPSTPFPFYTKGRIMSPIVLTNLRSKELRDKNPNNKGLTLLVPSFDGYLYVIDGSMGCYDVVDIGETSYGAPLVDDVTGNGKMDVVIATMNGNVYLFESSDAEYDVSYYQTSQVHGVNNLAARGGEGAYAVKAVDRNYRDIRGMYMDVRFAIMDDRYLDASYKSKSSTAHHGPYHVTVMVTAPGFSKVVNTSYDKPGSYTVRLDVPNTRCRGKVSIQCADGHKLFSHDAYAVSFHTRFYRALKWVLALPFAAATVAVITLAQNEELVKTFMTRGLLGDGMGRRDE